MSSSAINTQVAQLKIGNVQNQADSSSVYSNGVWSFKNSTALTSVTITDAGRVGVLATSPRGVLDLNTTREAKIYLGTAGVIGETQANAGDYIANNLFVSAETAGTMTYTKTTADSGNAIVQDFSRGIAFYSGVTGAASSTGTLNNFERMRIDANGNVLVGTTSAASALAKFQVVSSGANNGMLATTDVANQPPYLSWNRATSGNNIFVYCTTETTGGFGLERGYLYFDRAAGQVKVSATSDERLKTNIKDAPSLLEKVCAIKVREYAWKETGSENIGFIAQELNAVIPRAVWEGEDNEDGTIKRPWSVDNPTLVPYLVKAIQELSAKNDALEARLAALESKP